MSRQPANIAKKTLLNLPTLKIYLIQFLSRISLGEMDLCALCALA
jgi:hypothetical protein